MFRSGVPRGPKESGFSKSSSPKLVEEGAAFLGSRDSRKPILLGQPSSRRERLLGDKFSRVNAAPEANDAGEFQKDRLPLRVEVKDPVHQRDTDAPVSEREPLGGRVVEANALNS